MNKHIRFFAVVLVALVGVSDAFAEWRHAHGDAGNIGLVRVDTLPAQSPTKISGVGPVAAGTNPVIGPDGTVYIGNLDGELKAFHPDGSEAWTRQLNPNHGRIMASPVVGADGSIYVVSVFDALVRQDGNSIKHNDSWLHKFTPGGGWLFATPFPETNYVGQPSTGITSAPPNIWRWNGSEVIMVPVQYHQVGNHVHLVAFSPTGSVLANQFVSYQSYDVTGSSSIIDAIGDFFETLGDCLDPTDLGCGFSASAEGPLDHLGWPMPGVGIWEYPQGSPWIWMADGFKSTVAYKFDLEQGFSEIYRFSDEKERRSSPPTALYNVFAAVGTEDGRLKYERDSREIAGFGPITAAPTQLSDGRLALVQRRGRLSVVNGDAVELDMALTGDSMVSAAASCKHVFVSSTQGLMTLDAKSLSQVSLVAWNNGGISAPVIGAQGQVYAIAGRQMYVFPGPPVSLLDSVRPRRASCDPIKAVDDGSRSSTKGVLFSQGFSQTARRP